jgi:hypothetical protein
LLIGPQLQTIAALATQPSLASQALPFPSTPRDLSLIRHCSPTRTCSNCVLRKASHSPCKRSLSLTLSAQRQKRVVAYSWHFLRSGISPVAGFPGESCSVRSLFLIAQLDCYKPVRAARRCCWSCTLDLGSRKRYCFWLLMLAYCLDLHAHFLTSPLHNSLPSYFSTAALQQAALVAARVDTAH